MTIIDNKQLADLERLAKAATRGPWTRDAGRVCDGNCGNAFAYIDHGKPYTEYHGGCLTVAVAELGDGESDARFIAAANPTTIAALVAEIRRLRLEVDALRQPPHAFSCQCCQSVIEVERVTCSRCVDDGRQVAHANEVSP